MKRYLNWSRPIAAGIACVCFAAPNTHAESGEKSSPGQQGYTVQWVAKMMTVHRDGDARPRTKLEPLAHRDGGFAIGPVAGLRGEITVVDGKAYIARITDGAEHVEPEWDVEAPFLVYGQVERWIEMPLPKAVASLAGLEQWLPEAAKEHNIDTSKPFPFKVRCPKPQIDYHVISNREPGYQVSRPHRELMKFFSLTDQGATLLGVYSTEHAGIFTHHGSATHIHMVSDNEAHSGHVDAATFGDDAVLLLPRN